jgi:hypothetical protein
VLELVLVAQLNAVDRLAVDAVRFPTDVVAHAGARHQIALIGGVDEHLRLHVQAALGDQRENAVALLP